MATTISCDLAIVGGGLAGGLIALALAERRPELNVLLIEGALSVGGNHLWSFFDADVAAADRWLVEPIVAHRWPGYFVSFPGLTRKLEQPYNSVPSERLDAAVRAALPPERLLTGVRAIGVSPTAIVLADGRRVDARAVIDARGMGDAGTLELGWQKFVGREIVSEAPHGLTRPVVMDATVEQLDGYRFVYLLPFGPNRLFVEDTYYSDGPTLDVAAVDARIAAYCAQRGWNVVPTPDIRRETGVLPVVIGGDFAAYWAGGGRGVPKAGVRAGLFHPTTGYSLPDAVRTAIAVAGARDLSAPALHDLLHDLAARAWRARAFYRMLDRMLFHAAEPAERYRVLRHFYRQDPALIARFYAARTTALDGLRILSGRPPVPVGRAIAALSGGLARRAHA